MKKNILIIGYGEIASRLYEILDLSKYKVIGVSRNNKKNLDYHLCWDWLSNNSLSLEPQTFDSIIFFPKPNSINENDYKEGFLKSSTNINNFVKTISYQKFISISSTRVYGLSKKEIVSEDDILIQNGFRSEIIQDYEKKQINYYKDKLIILRFAGLYDQNKPHNYKNFLSRNNAAKIIKFFIENDFKFKSPEIFNCCEDNLNLNKERNISNNKLKKLGFNF